jgi:hypothetical protein
MAYRPANDNALSSRPLDDASRRKNIHDPVPGFCSGCLLLGLRLRFRIKHVLLLSADTGGDQMPDFPSRYN